MVQAAEIRGRRDSLIAQPIARQVAEAAAETIAAWIIADARQASAPRVFAERFLTAYAAGCDARRAAGRLQTTGAEARAAVAAALAARDARFEGR